jgi:hypothetical protein
MVHHDSRQRGLASALLIACTLWLCAADVDAARVHKRSRTEPMPAPSQPSDVSKYLCSGTLHTMPVTADVIVDHVTGECRVTFLPRWEGAKPAEEAMLRALRWGGGGWTLLGSIEESDAGAGDLRFSSPALGGVIGDLRQLPNGNVQLRTVNQDVSLPTCRRVHGRPFFAEP